MANGLKDFLSDLGRAKQTLQTNTAESPIGKVVTEFVEESIEGAQDAMKSSNRNASSSLSQSLEPVIDLSVSGKITIEILAENYWDFINSGVDGIEVKRNAPYSFKTPNPSKKMVDAFTGNGSIQNWMASRGIKELRYPDKDGKLVTIPLITTQDYRNAAFVFARATKRHGILGNQFLTSQFTEQKLNTFTDKLGDAFIKSF